MSRRRKIGLITAVPESVHSSRVLRGIFSQCEKYGYDVAVFASLTHVCSAQREYLEGELNIYELINFDSLDGVIVDVIQLIENDVTDVLERIGGILSERCRKPVVTLSLPLENYPVANNSDSPVFREITEHLLDVHDISRIYFLTGPEENSIAKERLNVFLEVMHERNIEVPPEHIFYGDFWYTAGSQLGERLASGELPMPQAVICASDHMAIGLANRLAEKGVRVPQDVIITGFEATQEAALNDISITSFESNAAKTAADAVDMLRRQMEPEADILPYDDENTKHIHAGMSCGCLPDFLHSAKVFKESFYYLYRDYTQEKLFENIDIGQLMEGYAPEMLTGSESAEKCLENIYLTTYYLRPYNGFYLCLRDDWLTASDINRCGYPPKMEIAVYTTPDLDSGFFGSGNSIEFDTSLMLPYMHEEHDDPNVYYFSAVHFNEKSYGYAVLERKLSEERRINLVYRNWLRFVNTSLEMVQTRNRLEALSVRDQMTGAYNRRGMDKALSQMLEQAKEGDMLLVCVIDMDGLKYINDNFGHNEGDFGIKLVYSAADSVAVTGEICVRAGGDELYIIGAGRYTEADVEARIKRFNDYLTENSRLSGKPYTVTASAGYSLTAVCDGIDVNAAIKEADERMYKNKTDRKKQRQV